MTTKLPTAWKRLPLRLAEQRATGWASFLAMAMLPFLVSQLCRLAGLVGDANTALALCTIAVMVALDHIRSRIRQLAIRRCNRLVEQGALIATQTGDGKGFAMPGNASQQPEHRLTAAWKEVMAGSSWLVVTPRSGEPLRLRGADVRAYGQLLAATLAVNGPARCATTIGGFLCEIRSSAPDGDIELTWPGGSSHLSAREAADLLCWLNSTRHELGSNVSYTAGRLEIGPESIPFDKKRLPALRCQLEAALAGRYHEVAHGDVLATTGPLGEGLAAWFSREGRPGQRLVMSRCGTAALINRLAALQESC